MVWILRWGEISGWTVGWWSWLATATNATAMLLLMVAPDGDAEADDGVVSGDFIYLIGADEPEMVGCQSFVRASRTLIRDAPPNKPPRPCAACVSVCVCVSSGVVVS